MDVNVEAEKQAILKDYRQLLRLATPRMKKGDDKRIRHAFELAVDAHKHMRRKSGEPYIHHPLAVAKIVSGDMGLGHYFGYLRFIARYGGRYRTHLRRCKKRIRKYCRQNY
jgi:hypothetical protein